MGFQLGPGPDQAGPGQLLDGGDGVQFGDDAEPVSSGKCGLDCYGVYVEIRELVGDVFHPLDGVVRDERDDFGDRELDLKCHEVNEGLLGVKFAVRTAVGHPGGRVGGGVLVQYGVSGFGQRLAVGQRPVL